MTEVTIDQDNTIWRVEGSYKWPVSKRVKLGAVLGYVDYDITSTLTIESCNVGFKTKLLRSIHWTNTYL